jgi:hypothetical protein
MKTLLFLLLTVVTLSSCTKTMYVGRLPQTNFSFPNANVTPLNKVTGEASKVKLLMPPMINSAMVNEAYGNAMSKAQGSDGLINVDIYQKQTNLLIVQIMKYMVEGTAVKQEIGKQKLN